MIVSFLLSVLASPLLPFILTLTLGLLSLILILVFGSKVQLDRQISSWPSTPGKIETAQVHKTVVQRGTVGSYRNATVYIPKIQYTYTIQGALFHGDTIGNRPSYSDMGNSGAKRLVGRFPAGATVPVYYNPEAHTQAVLEKTLLPNLFGLFLGFGVAGLALVLAGFGIYELIFWH